MNSTIDWPKPLSNIIGASGDSAQWNPIVADLSAGQGVLVLGSVLSAGSDGKMKLTDASSYTQPFGILLEPWIPALTLRQPRRSPGRWPDRVASRRPSWYWLLARISHSVRHNFGSKEFTWKG
jgi:hypothetical protein